MRGSLRGTQLQRAELRARSGLPQMDIETLVKPGGTAEHSARACEQEILRL
jgi:hypothetical protein